MRVKRTATSSLGPRVPEELKSWILTTTWDCHPDGVLSLGQILTDPGDPSSALIQPGKSDDTPSLPKLSRHDIRHHVNIESTDGGQTDIGSWAKLNATLVARSQAFASIGNSSSAKFTLEISELETKVLEPTNEYTEKVFDSGGMTSDTSWWKSRKRIFMVTGVRIARGAVMSSGQIQSQAMAETFQAPVSDQSPNASQGLGVGTRKVPLVSQIRLSSPVSNFVFAYRLHEINYRIRGPVGDPSSYKPEDIEQTPLHIGSFKKGGIKS